MVSVISALLLSCTIAALQTVPRNVHQAFFSPVTEVVSIHTLTCTYDSNYKLSN